MTAELRQQLPDHLLIKPEPTSDDDVVVDEYVVTEVHRVLVRIPCYDNFNNLRILPERENATARKSSGSKRARDVSSTAAESKLQPSGVAPQPDFVGDSLRTDAPTALINGTLFSGHWVTKHHCGSRSMTNFGIVELEHLPLKGGASPASSLTPTPKTDDNAPTFPGDKKVPSLLSHVDGGVDADTFSTKKKRDKEMRQRQWRVKQFFGPTATLELNRVL